MPNWYARHAMEEWATAIGRLMDLRDRIGPARFYDIAFRDFMADPIREIRGLYQWLGWELSAGTVKLMLAWQTKNPKPSHQVTMEKYGLDEQSIARTYRFYTERFAGCSETFPFLRAGSRVRASQPKTIPVEQL